MNTLSVKIVRHPIIIDFNSGKIYGIFRGSKDSKKVVILCPAATGTRIGPQRIYVEIAHKLEKINVASFCADLPPLGDSFDNKIERYEGAYSERLAQQYSKYLKIIIEYLENEFSFSEFILLGISDACLPIYYYAKKSNEIQRVILLSPNHLLDTLQRINSKNLKQYYIKLFKKETWIKLIFLKLDIKKIIRNIYRIPKRRKHPRRTFKEIKADRTIEGALVIFGENDAKLKEYIEHWVKEKHNIGSYSERIIKGADHSFFGWQFKRDVENAIIEWI